MHRVSLLSKSDGSRQPADASADDAYVHWQQLTRSQSPEQSVGTNCPRTLPGRWDSSVLIG
jgi:hypothetical protein